MKWLCLPLIVALIMQHALAQDNILTQVLEDQASVDDSREMEEDLQQLQFLTRYPLNLNTAEPEAFSVFPFITSLQVSRMVLYRKMLGPLQNVLELQAVPGWTAEMIRRIKPYVTISVQAGFVDELMAGAGKGRHQLLTRMAIRKNNVAEYLGSPPSVLLRYQFRSKNLQLGINTEKDGGERFFQHGKGVSFVSFHAGIYGMGPVKILVIGDYLINMGQGLIHWQGRGARKTGMPIMIRHQLPFIQPYRSNDENRFHRGIAFILNKGRFEAGMFFSNNKIDANRNTDTLTGKEYISSFINSGYHRTISEIRDKDALKLTATGGMITYRKGEFRSSINVIYNYFSLPIHKENQPYQRFAFRGSQMANYSMDYQHTLRNVHFFGEIAMDEKKHLALMQGLMFSADPRLDISFLYRKIPRNYHSFQASAFTESTEPANEEGVYTGASFRISPTLSFDAYIDYYRFPWLKYRLDMPGHGMDYLLQCTWRPNKKTTIYCRYRTEKKTENLSSMNLIRPVSNQILAVPDAMNPVGIVQKINWRFHLDQHFSLQMEWRVRIEYINVWLGTRKETGFLIFSDIFWAPPNSHFSFNTRLMSYETTSYTSRIYAFENDVMYYNIVPSFFGRGSLAYLNTRFSPGKKLQLFLKSAFQHEKGLVRIQKMIRFECIFSW
jgi:Helix-hairpin-helix motif